jgi:hypothetical protein
MDPLSSSEVFLLNSATTDASVYVSSMVQAQSATATFTLGRPLHPLAGQTNAAAHGGQLLAGVLGFDAASTDPDGDPVLAARPSGTCYEHEHSLLTVDETHNCRKISYHT